MLVGPQVTRVGAPRPAPAQNALAHGIDLGRGWQGVGSAWHSARQGPPRHPARPCAQDGLEREDPVLTAGVSQNVPGATCGWRKGSQVGPGGDAGR